jgi:hypothetical protein
MTRGGARAQSLPAPSMGQASPSVLRAAAAAILVKKRGRVPRPRCAARESRSPNWMRKTKPRYALRTAIRVCYGL